MTYLCKLLGIQKLFTFKLKMPQIYICKNRPFTFVKISSQSSLVTFVLITPSFCQFQIPKLFYSCCLLRASQSFAAVLCRQNAKINCFNILSNSQLPAANILDLIMNFPKRLIANSSKRKHPSLAYKNIARIKVSKINVKYINADLKILEMNKRD